jgi:SAM-dependent methyltransferase
VGYLVIRIHFSDKLNGFPCGDVDVKGYKVTGIDISQTMLDKAKKNLIKNDVSAELFKEDILKPNNLLKGNFKAVVCAGNLLSYMGTADDVMRALTNINSYLSKGGLLLGDIYDYDFKFEGKPSESPIYDTVYYDGNEVLGLTFRYPDNAVIVNIKYKQSDGRTGISSESVKLNVFGSYELSRYLAYTGFKNIEAESYYDNVEFSAIKR